ncbi:MAG TPA: histidine phosphatase family protein [Tepidisphaeraceae bacterium]|nr:histidine phosphatase family protein [Tepidisphaeraceae bacterium]
MAKLILIKHAPPQVDAGVPSHEWRLSPAGRDKATALAERLRAHAPTIVFTSNEPKAIETAQIVADALAVRHEISPGLHEHDRSNVPQMPTREFISSVALFFKCPNELVLGRETAAQARQRVTGAIDWIVTQNGARDIAIVTHGTVLALYAAPLVKADPFILWRQLGLPSFLILQTPEMRVIERVDNV